MTVLSKDISIPPTNTDVIISLEDFLRLYSDVEDGFKYEWNNGKIEKTKTMNQDQIAFYDLLSRLFIKTKTFKDGGVFTEERDMNTSEKQLRKPDLSIYSVKQKIKMMTGEKQIALWVGEVISPTDNINRVNTKLDEYFEAGVKVVWHIFPDSNQIYVYTAPDKVKICRGKAICSGKPALEGFEISAKDLFAYKTKYAK